MLFKTRKGIMGIGTLIIFIAMVLVAAIAASVLIRTSGVLQERAFAVSSEVRQALVTKVELISVEGIVNQDNPSGFETIEGLEMRLKLSPGSYPIQLKSLLFEFISSKANLGATIALEPFDNLNMPLPDMTNGTMISLGDVNEDDFADYVTLVNVPGGDHLLFNYSDGSSEVVELVGHNDAHYDLSVGSQTIWIKNLPVPMGDSLLGFLNIQGSQTTVDELNSTSLNMSIKESSTVCDVDLVIPETKYCYPKIKHVIDEDSIIEPGEVFLFKYKLTPENELSFEEEFEISFIPKAGAEERRRIKVPDVLNQPRILLWPN